MWYITIMIMLAISMYVGYRFTLYVDDKIERSKYKKISDNPNHIANQGDHPSKEGKN
ncbi:hypothetical protein [Caedibacter taeniospiralis]